MDVNRTIAVPAVVGSALYPVGERGWAAGLANLLRRESSVWWATRKGMVHLLLWLTVLSGFGLLGAVSQEQGQVMTMADRVLKTVTVFFGFGTFAAVAGVVITAQGALIEEKQLGTAAWILSKPVTRSAVILSKLLAYAGAFACLMVVIPGAAFYGASLLLWGSAAPAAGPFTVALGVLGLYLLFYLTLTLLLGAVFNARGPAAGVALSGLIMGQVVGSLLPGVAIMTPWALPQVAVALALRQSLPSLWPVSIATTLIICAACVLGAIWRFTRDEF